RERGTARSRRRETEPQVGWSTHRPDGPDPDDHQDQARHQDQANDSELSESLDVERVCVADEGSLEARMLGPPELEGARSDPMELLGLECIDRRLPELIAAAAACIHDLARAALSRSTGVSALEIVPAVLGLPTGTGRQRDRRGDQDRTHRGK